MNFVQSEFLWFLTAVLLAYHPLGRAPRGRRLQNLLLLLASAVFYGWVHPWFLGLLLASSLTDWAAGLAIAHDRRWRDLALTASILVNLGLLAYFKYFDFFVGETAAALSALGVENGLRPLGVVLPVGISFYTFQTMSYTIDVYRGTLAARRDVLDYLLYVLFFPQLVAGPIERADRLLSQIERDRTTTWEQAASGLSLAMWGAFKKLCIADTIAPYVDKVFVLDDPSGPLIWAASLAFSLQIFADFSGYTDIARGTARMLGFELTANFASPYLAASTPEFWQRWHISLSTWIRDYLFVPLLGSGATVSMARFVGATMVTFAAIGFWHGASWNFLLFGLWHGVWMTAYTLGGRGWGDRPVAPRPLRVLFHFVVVSLPGSLLFRETRIDRLAHHLTVDPFRAPPDEAVAAVVVVGMTAVFAIPLVAGWAFERWLHPVLRGTAWAWPVATTGWATAAVAMFVFYRLSSYDFIYFRF